MAATGSAAHRRNRTADPARWRRWTLVLIGTPFFLVVSDATIVYTALPSIGTGLAVPEGRLHWVVVAYLLTSGGLLLAGGRAADLFGRRRMFLTGLGLFTAMSLWCGLARSGEGLIAARAVEGLGAAILTPAALSILVATFPEGRDRNRALGAWGALAGIGATTGLLLGGPITQLLGWRWIFLVNVPIGVGVMIVGGVLLAGGRPQARRQLDLAGGLVGTLALLALVAAIVDAPRAGAATRPVLLLLVASALAGLFVTIEHRAPAPLLPLRILRSRSLVAGNLVVLAAGMSVDGLLYSFTFLAQEVFGASPIRFGLAMAVMTSSSFLGVVAGQHLVSRIGVRPVAAAGLVLISAGSLALAVVAAGGRLSGWVVAGLVIFGPGLGVAFVAGQIAALTGVDDADAGLASGIEETTFAIASALGVAVVVAIVLAIPDPLAGGRTALLGPAGFAAAGLAAIPVLRPGVGVDAAHGREGVQRGQNGTEAGRV